MAKITFNKHRQATIKIDNIGNDISFLMSPVFDNSESNLLRDIELCENKEMKKVLESIYEHIKVSENISEEDDAKCAESEITLEFQPGDDGDWCAVVHNIKPEHSGYWYAAQDLETEKCSLIKLRHELEGIKIGVEKIDTVITMIRSAVSTDDAVDKLMDLGLDLQQAKAILRMNITEIVGSDSSSISEQIVVCDDWIEFIENIRGVTIESKITIGDAIKNLEKSTTFQMSLGSKELFHSNFLQWIFKIKPEMFKRMVDNLLGYEMEFPDKFTVKREYNNYDLCIVHEEKNFGKSKDVIDLIIENKVKSIPYKEQLEKYYSETPNIAHLLLTIVTEFVGKDDINNWQIKSYAEFADAIDEATKSSKITDSYRAIIEDYILFVRNLNLIADGCSINNTVSYFNPYSQKLNELRINDLIEKLRTCEIAMQLKKRINGIIDELNTEENVVNRKYKLNYVKSLVRDAMFKNCRVGDAIINYGLTHAQGLFELKVIVKTDRKEKVALVIQVQGDRYCHAIELSGTKKDYKKNWENISAETSPYRWFLFPHDGLPSKKGKEYNKYGNEFLYRYQKIGNDMMVEEIINRICTDYYAILQTHILNRNE